VAQGVANIGSVLFFGVPATGAIARTVANIKNGGKTPVAGMLHAVFILVFMLLLSPLAKMIPLSALSAVLLIVAWNISEIDHFRNLLRAPKSDVLVLLTTFGLTVFADLTIAVGVGMVLASMLFMKQMADVSNISDLGASNGSDEAETAAVAQKDPGAIGRRHIPAGVEVYEIDGPFFFGVADRLKDTLNQFERPPKVFILRMRHVPHIDATGMHALEEFYLKCKRQGTRLMLGGVHAQPLFEFVRIGFDQTVGLENIFENLDDALARRGGMWGRRRRCHRAGVARRWRGMGTHG
jgi:SulP family sulfate permease